MEMKRFINLNLMLIAGVAILFQSCGQTNQPDTEVVEVAKQLTFKQLSAKETGINFENKLIETPEINVLTYQYFHNGGGVCVGDINNDGLPDVYFTSNLEPNILYLNNI